jgi:tetratricopeptide (TPR) repeat protein
MKALKKREKMKKLVLSLFFAISFPLLGNRIAEYQTMLTKNPQDFETLFNLGLEYFRASEHNQAITHLLKARDIEPEHAQLYFNLGLVYMAQDNYTQAASCFEQAVTHKSDYAKAYYFLGSACQKLNQEDAALEHFQKAISFTPDNHEALVAIARIYRNKNQAEQAVNYYQKALALQPNNIHILFDVAYLYTVNGQYEPAVNWYKKLLAIAPDTVDASCNIAHVLRYQGRMHEAIPYYQQVLQKRPDFSHAHYGLAESYLSLGDFERGFKEFEWRWKRNSDARNFSTKLWNGEPLQGKSILVRGEYGQGDTLQFIRYVKQLKELGATVVVEAQHTLVKLLSLNPYIDKIFPVLDDVSQLPVFDYQVPVMSLPHLFKTTLQTIPSQVPYLQASEELTAQWKEKLKDDHNFKVGICWEGSPYYEQFKAAASKKSVPLNTFIPLTQVPGVSVYALQKMNGLEQLKALPSDVKITDFGEDFDGTNGRFMDTAAVINNLDLVITVDTSVAHLAGALGKPVWVLLPSVADWRWMLNRSDCPWYPTMQVFRQHQQGDWTSVMQTVINELKPAVAQKQKDQPKRSIKMETPIATQTQNSPPALFGAAQSSKSPLSVFTEVQIGELIDKITILQIKSERIKDATKLKNINAELKTLMDDCKKNVPQTEQLLKLWNELKDVNEKLWVIEDDIRDKEKAREFDQKFVEIARSVYYTNDERCRIKREINMLLGSRLMEEKSYSDYKSPSAK